jgi:hypothetical protein
VVFGEQLGHTSLTTFREPSLQTPKGLWRSSRTSERILEAIDLPVWRRVGARLRPESKWPADAGHFFHRSTKQQTNYSG